MRQIRMPMNLYRTPCSPAYWHEANLAMKCLKLLVFAALMIAVTRALSLIPGIPIWHTKLTWGFLARSVCALVCGPVLGLVFGFVEDILGFILQPTGDFFPGYTLSTMAGVLVYALFFFRRRITVVNLVLANAGGQSAGECGHGLGVEHHGPGRGISGLVHPQPGQEPDHHSPQGGGAVHPVSGAAPHPAPDGPDPRSDRGADSDFLSAV